MPLRPPHLWPGDVIDVRYLSAQERAILDLQDQFAQLKNGVVMKLENPDPDANNLAPEQLFDAAAERAAALDTEPVTRTFTESSREASTVRIENPEDSEQYVDVSRAESIVLVAEDGEKVVLVFDNA